MLQAEEQMMRALVFVVQMTPIGTNLGLLSMMWAMVNGSFLQSRGAIFSALSLNGFTPEEVRRSWAAMRNGAWKISELIAEWNLYVTSENACQENQYAGLRVVSIDITGFWRPKLQGWLVKHYHSVAGKALPAVVLGVMVTSGQVQGRRIPLLQAIVRRESESSEADFRGELLKAAASRPQSECEVKVVDGGFGLREIHAAKLKKYVVRMAKNGTARRNVLPTYKGKGRHPTYGLKVRPLARKHKGKMIPATAPEQISEFEVEGRMIQVHSWSDLVTSTTQVSPDATTFFIHVFYYPAYKTPLILVTDLDISAENIYLIYKDRWTVEQPPLAAKQMIGLHRQFVFTKEACFRLPELALLAGNVLTYVAATLPAIPTGFWDRNPQSTPGRLRRFLAQVIFPNLSGFSPEIRKKNSPTDHLPKGADAPRQKPLAA